MRRAALIFVAPAFAVVAAFTTLPVAASTVPLHPPFLNSAPGRDAQKPDGWLDPRFADARSPRELLYVADGQSVDIYPANSHAKNPTLIGQLTGLDAPWDVAVDRYRNLYVLQQAIGAPVLVFAPGATTPSRSLDVEGAAPLAVAIGPHGDVFVSTADVGALQLSVLVYRQSATKPYTVLSGFFDGDDTIVADRDNDLFVRYFPFQSIGMVAGEFKATGKGQWQGIANLGFGIIQPNALALDRAGNLVIEEEVQPDYILGVYAPGSIVPERQIALPAGTFAPQHMVFNKAGNLLYVGGGKVQEVAYPSGDVDPNAFTPPSGFAYGVAVSPREELAPGW